MSSNSRPPLEQPVDIRCDTRRPCYLRGSAAAQLEELGFYHVAVGWSEDYRDDRWHSRHPESFDRELIKLLQAHSESLPHVRLGVRAVFSMEVLPEIAQEELFKFAELVHFLKTARAIERIK